MNNNIVFISQCSFDTRPAAATHVFEIATNLAKDNSVVLFLPEGRMIALESKVEVRRIKGKGSFRLSRIFFQYQLFIQLYRMLRRDKVDFIYLRFANFMLVPILLSMFFKVKMILEINGLSSVELPIVYDHKFIKPFIFICKMFEEINLYKSSAIFTISEILKENILRNFPRIPKGKIIVIPNGANTNLFKPMEVDKRKYGFETEDIIVGFVGGFHPWMGVGIFIESYPFVKKQIPNIKFVLVGGGKRLDFMKAEASKYDGSIQFFGQRPYEEIPELTNLFDICVAPYTDCPRNTNMGGSSLKICEYLACGKPVVTTDIAGISDIVSENDVGIVVKPSSAKSLADGIIKLARDEELRKGIGMRGRGLILHKYSWAISSRKIDIIMDKMKEICPDNLEIAFK